MDDLVKYIRASYSPQEKIKVAKDGTETLFFRKAGKPLCYIETKDGKSKVTVVIGVSLADKVKEAKLSKQTIQMFENAKQFYDGKWLLFDMQSKNDLADIKTLLAIKRAPRLK